MNYQKLYNYIFNQPNNENINFHEKVFITEVNSIPSKKTRNAPNESIPFRKENFLKSKFIQSFPIVIIGGVGYFELTETKNEIEEIFKVEYAEKRIAGNKQSQRYWIHWSSDKSKLLINTYQLSMCISDVLLQEIAHEIKLSGLI